MKSAPFAVADQILIIDDVLPDPEAYRALALAQPFGSVMPAPGVTFHGIALDPSQELPGVIAAQWPKLEPRLSFFRKSPAGQVEPNYVHTDRDMGEWTALLYLTPDPPKDDGTTFWLHRASGATRSPLPLAVGVEDWKDRSLWEPWFTVSAAFNRLVLFSAPYFHSRAIEANYGTGDAARLIQVVFGTGALPVGGV